MDEKRDARFAIVATILIVALLLGQVVLLAAHLWAPMVRTADRLIADENAPLDEGPEVAAGPEADAEPAPARPDPWRWVALAMTVLCAALGLFAAWRLHEDSAERGRWMTVLMVAALAVAWGIFTFRLIARSAIIFEGF
ncbi:MAG: hypothetical protein ACOCX2_14465 [Armatimonadota bacterium]